jgi:hypothetical protein
MSKEDLGRLEENQKEKNLIAHKKLTWFTESG